MIGDLRIKLQMKWDQYLIVWKSINGWKLFLFYTLHYTLLFVVVSHFIFLPFEEAKKTFIWVHDGLPGYFADELVYISQTIRNGIQKLLAGEELAFPLYDFRRGVMKPIFEREPLQWLAVFWPWDKIDILYDLLVLFRYYLTGLSFSLLGFFFRQNILSIMIGAVSYSFCGFAIYAGVRHPYFLAPMIFLPLLIVGTEKVMRKERAWVFTISIALTLLSSLYFSCMIAIIITIYITVRYCCTYLKDGIHSFIHFVMRILFWGGMGILLGAISWVPTLIQMLQTGRIGGDVLVKLKYASSYYQNFLSYFIVVPGNIGSWTCLGFSVLAVPTILLLLFDKRKEVRSLKILFLVFTGMLCIPEVGYIMSGFNTYSNRWVFAYALCIAAILMVEISLLLTAERKLLALIGGGTVVYVAVCYFLVKPDYYHKEAIAMLLISMAVIAFCYIAGKKGKPKILPLCLVITCLSTNYSGFMMYSPECNNYIAEFTDKGSAYTILESGQYASLGHSEQVHKDSSLFYVLGNAITRPEINSSYFSDVNGLSYFSSSMYESYRTLIDQLEIGHRYLNIIDYGMDGQAALMSLSNVKYYALRETGQGVVPFGMEEIDHIKNGKNIDIILENPYALSVGYTYDSWQSEETLMALPAAGRQDAMLQAVVLNEMPEQENLFRQSIKTSCLSIPAVIESMDGISWSDGKLKVEQEHATITLGFSGIPEAETYLRVVNLDLTSGSSSRRWSLTVDTGTTKTTSYFSADGYVYSSGAKTQLIYLGNSSDGYTSCTLTFPQKGTFILDDLEIWCQPMDNYAEQIEALRAEPLENVKTNWRGLTGTISVSKDKFLCFSIPYDEGWTAYVDGEKANLVQANIGFMGVELSAGDHDIELKYWPPGLTAGIVLSCIGLIGAICLFIYMRKSKRKGAAQ